MSIEHAGLRQRVEQHRATHGIGLGSRYQVLDQCMSELERRAWTTAGDEAAIDHDALVHL